MQYERETGANDCDGCGKIVWIGTVSTLAGTVGVSGNVNGQGTNAKLGTIYGIAVNSAGSIFVSDNTYHVIRQVTSSGLFCEFDIFSNQYFSIPNFHFIHFFHFLCFIFFWQVFVLILFSNKRNYSQFISHRFFFEIQGLFVHHFFFLF